MEIEQRGISVASSMEYRDLRHQPARHPRPPGFLKTPTVLTAVDAALMVIDAASRAANPPPVAPPRRGTPILTFRQQMDREVQDPIYMDEIERELGTAVVPHLAGMGKLFHGVYDRREERMRVFSPGEDKAGGDDEILPAWNAEATKRLSRSPSRRRTSWSV
jgi:peptide chain release factor 3